MTLLKQIIAEANGIYEPITDADFSKINKTNKLNGGKIVKSGKYALQVQQVPVGSQVHESEALKAVLNSQDGDDTDEVENAGGATTADKLEIGAAVKIKGTDYDGQEGTIDSFGRDKKFVIVKLADAKHSFHSSDVISSEDSEDEDDEDSTPSPSADVKKFYVSFYDSTRETSWIGKVSRENGGMWHEKPQQGKPDIIWGKEHEKYMSPDDIVGLYHRKMPHSLKIEGPFYELEDAEEFIEDNWGDIRESAQVKLDQIAESLESFHRNALKALNAVLKRINTIQAMDKPAFSNEGEKNLRKVYRALYGALIDGGAEEFIKAWDKAAHDNVDAFDEFADMLFQHLGVKDFPEFSKKLGLKKAKKEKVTEALNADGYHTSLKNPKFIQNNTLLVHGDPREYLHDESNATPRKKDKTPMLVTFQKKSQADNYAKQFGATVVTTPSHTYRLVSKKATAKKVEKVEEAAHEGEQSYTDFNLWKKAVLATYPELKNKLKLKGRVEAGEQTISYEIPGEDRSYGVWYPKKDEGSVLFESMFGPMGGDQRNMRGSHEYEPKSKTSFNGFVQVNFPDWYKKDWVNTLVKKFNVALTKASDNTQGKNLRITGSKKNIKAFLINSGWNKTDVEEWYPELDEAIEMDEIILLGEDILSEAEIKVQALKVATNLLGTVDVKKTDIDDEDVLKAREFNKKQLFSADGQRWFISLFQLASGKRFARILPPKDSGTNPFFVTPTKGQ